MLPDGSAPRQLTNARDMTTDPDGTVHVELPTRSRTRRRKAI